MSQIKGELKEEKEKSELLSIHLNKYKEIYEAKNNENNAMKKQISELDTQLNKAKNEIKNSQLAPRMFQVERIKDGFLKSKKVMTITFQWNQHKNICEMVLKRMKHGGKVKEDIVNIIDISTFKVNDKKKENIDIVFTVSFNIYNIYYVFNINKYLFYNIG